MPRYNRPIAMPEQPPLFPDFEPAPTSSRKTGAAQTAAALEERYARLREVAGRLPANVRFGTSSWSFPGWQGLVYSQKRTTGWLAKEGLREYAQHPLFGTVGVDRSYYAPVPHEDFRRYADQLPDGFPCCCKAPGLVTSPVQIERGPAEPNPQFLSADRFVADLLDPVARSFRGHAGPFILQFPPMLRRSGIAPAIFFEGLDRFLGSLPRDFQYAVEVRDRALLSDDYLRVITAHGAAHVYNAWTAMPLPGAQAAIVPVETDAVRDGEAAAAARCDLRGAARGVRAVRPDPRAAGGDARAGGGPGRPGRRPRHPRVRAGEQQGGRLFAPHDRSAR